MSATPPSPPESSGRDRTRIARLLFLLSLVGVCGVVAWWLLRPGPERLLKAAAVALSESKPEEAFRLADRVTRQSPDSAAAWALAGRALEQLGRRDEALRSYRRIGADASAETIADLEAGGKLAVSMGRLTEAEELFQTLLRADPNNLLAHRRLAAIYVVEGRRRESIPHLFELLRQKTIDLDELALLGNVEQVFDNRAAVDHFRRTDPDNPFLLLGAARIEIFRSEWGKARRLLEQAATRMGDQVHLEVSINLGKVLAEAGSEEEFDRWQAKLPAEAEAHPDLWAVRGQWAQQIGDADGAIRCYWEAVRRDPNHWRANYQLAQLLIARGESEDASGFLERGRKLQMLSQALKRIQLKRESVELSYLRQAASLTEDLARIWEAWAWHSFASAMYPNSDGFEEKRDALAAKLSESLPQTAPESNPALAVDLSAFPVPRWRSPATPSRDRATDELLSQVRFSDVSGDVGLDFTYLNGKTASSPGLRIWQSFGGGVAVIDFDGDGWPDTYFTQGGSRPADPKARTPEFDRLFRNDANGRLVDVTRSAGLSEDGYSQGVAAGDIDSDGFADLYIANIGRNRLYRNNGDGTFADVTAQWGLTADEWTSSCLLADLSGDGLVDVYDVGYLAGREPLTRVCQDSNDASELVACSPAVFDAEQDRLYINRGDGMLQDATESAGIVAPDGKGLGILAADFEGSGRLSLFVANDTTANFLFVNEAAADSAMPAFRETALLSGCALDSNGRPQACMGIACDDIDGNHLLDLLVTNFHNEYNILYSRQSSGLFEDRSHASGSKDPSISQLGFGCQFIDAELDGWPDLVVVNGHIEDHTEAGIPYRMRPQFFSNRGEGRFVEHSAAVGEFFHREQLGRSLVRLDWNRDGREDFAVSHLDTPAALVENQTPDAGHFLALRLRGVDSARDAIGATVRVTAGQHTGVKQLTAGDGYYASNQRQLVFGLGPNERIEELTVRWPSGLEQTFADVSADAEFLLREGTSSLLRIP